MRVLVAEDAKDMNRLIVKTLTRAGYSVDGCYNGEEALDFLAGAEYDAILLDVMMPKMDGYALLEKLRSQGMDTPVLFLTARDAISDRVKGLDLGADDYLVKPFDFEELLARIRAMTRKKSREAEQCVHPGGSAGGCPKPHRHPGRPGDQSPAQGIHHLGIYDPQPGNSTLPGAAGKPDLEL